MGRQVIHCGMVFCKPQSRTIGEIVAKLIELWEDSDVEKMRNRIEYVPRKQDR